MKPVDPNPEGSASEPAGLPSCDKRFGPIPPVDWELERAFERAKAKQAHDPVNHPQHYTNHPSGIEAIQITEHMSFCLGNALKYIWRADLKGGVEDLRKAAWYIDREIKRREKP